jgi:hypothetical protein
VLAKRNTNFHEWTRIFTKEEVAGLPLLIAELVGKRERAEMFGWRIAPSTPRCQGRQEENWVSSCITGKVLDRWCHFRGFGQPFSFLGVLGVLGVLASLARSFFLGPKVGGTGAC